AISSALRSGSTTKLRLRWYSSWELKTEKAGTPGRSQRRLWSASAASSTGGAPGAATRKRSSWRVGWRRLGKKTSLRLPRARVNQTLLSRPGADPNACFNPGPQDGGAPGLPGASMRDLSMGCDARHRPGQAEWQAHAQNGRPRTGDPGAGRAPYPGARGRDLRHRPCDRAG